MTVEIRVPTGEALYVSDRNLAAAPGGFFFSFLRDINSHNKTRPYDCMTESAMAESGLQSWSIDRDCGLELACTIR
jgi:hypothetical protein